MLLSRAMCDVASIMYAFVSVTWTVSPFLEDALAARRRLYRLYRLCRRTSAVAYPCRACQPSYEYSYVPYTYRDHVGYRAALLQYRTMSHTDLSESSERKPDGQLNPLTSSPHLRLSYKQ